MTAETDAATAHDPPARATRLGIITDEVSDDPFEACRLIREWGLSVIELRTAWGRNLLELEGPELDLVDDAVAQYELEVVGIGSPVFKSPLDERPRAQAADFALDGVESMSAQIELLEHACSLARRFGSSLVRVFTFWREPLTPEVERELIARLRLAAELARRHEVTLAVENEPACIVATGTELGRLFAVLDERLPAPLAAGLGALWDPGNALAGGEAEPYPGGYEAIDPARLAHLHLKDLRLDAAGTPQFVPLGEGKLDYRGQLARLEADGYRGDLVLEPHYRPSGLSRPQAAFACVTAARALLAEQAAA